MRFTIVGADFEENLGVGMVAAAAEAAGHAVRVVAFNSPAEAPALARAIAAEAPDVVGLSMQFQHRAQEFLALARRLRAEGYRGHVTCGAHFPTLAYREVLDPAHGIDSVVLHDGEPTIGELLGALASGRRLGEVAGLAFRGDDGAPVRTPGRTLPADLDALPFARRYRAHTRHLGVPFIPILGGRGCWGACRFCSISSFYRDARAHAGGGRTLRLRSPENVAAEMALLWHAAGGAGIFCFHDDNFLLPRPADTLARVRAMRAALDEYGVGRAALVGKARPDTVTPELLRELAALGLIRLYVGVENAAQPGADHLGRGVQTDAVETALAACREAGVFVCYNLLLFEPGTTLDHVRENLDFIRRHDAHPVNFCRAEPYHGTPLHLDLAARQAASGSWLGWNYRIADDEAELLFRVCAAAFRQRNFAPDGVANRYMGLGYSAKILERFHEERGAERAALVGRAGELTTAIVRDTADHLDDAIRLVDRFGAVAARDRLERETALLGLRIAASDRVWHAAIDSLQADMQAFVAGAGARALTKGRGPTRKLLEAARNLGFAATLGAWALGVEGCGSTTTVDPAPCEVDAGEDATISDPLPPDGATDGTIVDPPPPDAAVDVTIADPLPEDAAVPVDPLPPPSDAGPMGSLVPRHRPLLPLIDQWRDTAALAVRSADLPLHAPPAVVLDAVREGARIRVRVAGHAGPLSARWEGDGLVTADGCAATWEPTDPTDQLRVAVRTTGGIAVLALRAKDVSPG